MIPWALKRRALYLSGFALVLSLVFGVPLAVYLYEPPSCADGVMNQGENGIDCGGPCPLLCQSDSLPLIVDWTRKFEVAPALWSVAAHVQNPNFTSGAAAVPYLFQLYDAEGVIIKEKRGTVNVPPRADLIVFEGGLYIERSPARVTFAFTEDPVYRKMSADVPNIAVFDRVLSREEIRPNLEARLRNDSVTAVRNMPVAAVVYDKKGNAIAASRTLVEDLSPNETETVVFTWPQPFPVEEGYCEAPADVAILLDRSGSMDDERAVPPEPLSTVKRAASMFSDLLSAADRAAVISFATAASNPADQQLTTDRIRVQGAIGRIEIGTGSIQQTNVADALERARDELFSERHNDDARRVVVLLTDGVANFPKRDGDPDFAERHAVAVAADLKEKGVLVYTIGLGADINERFLQELATDPGAYYPAATPENLEAIYKAVATSICRKANTSRIDLNLQLYPGINF